MATVNFTTQGFRVDRGDRSETVEGILVRHDDVTALLGREHDGTAEDDRTIVAALLEAGAPAWVETAEGRVAEDGWWLLGPEIPEGADEWVEIDERVSYRIDSDDLALRVSCLDTEDDPDDGHAARRLARSGIVATLTGQGDAEGDQYVERVAFGSWRRVEPKAGDVD